MISARLVKFRISSVYRILRSQVHLCVPDPASNFPGICQLQNTKQNVFQRKFLECPCPARKCPAAPGTPGKSGSGPKTRPVTVFSWILSEGRRAPDLHGVRAAGRAKEGAAGEGTCCSSRLRFAAQHSTAQHSTAQHSAAQHSTAHSAQRAVRRGAGLTAGNESMHIMRKAACLTALANGMHQWI
eukprot:gene22758-biopygen1206